MHKTFATLVSLLCLALIAGYMASEARAQPLVSTVAAGAASEGATETVVSGPRSAKVTKAAAVRKRTVRKVVVRNGRRVAVVRRVAYLTSKRASPTVGQTLGLDKTADALDLRSNAAMVIDQESGEVLYEKNSDAVLPIASITKLMTALVVLDEDLPLDESIEIDAGDVDTEKGTRSRLAIGTTMTRYDALHLALMASENRAASALGRYYPGGIEAFVVAMNAKARMLGMYDTQYVDPSGLSPLNKSSASDLARLVRAAYEYPVIRELSTSTSHSIRVGRRLVQFHTTNRLVSSPNWEIGLQKTGYISEAGRCLVMQATIEGRRLVMILLDSWGKYSRIGDAGRIRTWLEASPVRPKTVSTVGAGTDS